MRNWYEILWVRWGSDPDTPKRLSCCNIETAERLREILVEDPRVETVRVILKKPRAPYYSLEEPY